jgi:hypothetical protein
MNHERAEHLDPDKVREFSLEDAIGAGVDFWKWWYDGGYKFKGGLYHKQVDARKVEKAALDTISFYLPEVTEGQMTVQTISLGTKRLAFYPSRRQVLNSMLLRLSADNNTEFDDLPEEIFDEETFLPGARKDLYELARLMVEKTGDK